MPKGKPTLAERVEIVLNAEGWSQSAMARAAGTGRQTVWNWLNDPTYDHMDAEYAFSIAEKSRSGFNPRWLYSGEGPERMPAKISREDQSVLDAIRELSGPRRQALMALLKP